MPGQRQKSLDMLAVPLRDIAHALARTLIGPADANVIQRIEPHPVQFKAPAADLARDFAEHIISRRLLINDAKNARFVGRGPMNQAYGARLHLLDSSSPAAPSRRTASSHLVAASVSDRFSSATHVFPKENHHGPHRDFQG